MGAAAAVAVVAGALSACGTTLASNGSGPTVICGVRIDNTQAGPFIYDLAKFHQTFHHTDNAGQQPPFSLVYVRFSDSCATGATSWTARPAGVVGVYRLGKAHNGAPEVIVFNELRVGTVTITGTAGGHHDGSLVLHVLPNTPSSSPT